MARASAKKRPEVVVLRTGAANTASVLAALARLGADSRLCEDAEQVRLAERLVLPGVGAFAAAIEHLRTHGMDQALRARIETGRSTLAICLGMQLLCEASEEGPGLHGLGLIPGVVRRFPPEVSVPQLGWNRIEPDAGCRLLAAGHVYFANSYRLTRPPTGFAVATAEHGGPFVAALEGPGLLACQFHPELSGSFGQALLRRWLAGEPMSC